MPSKVMDLQGFSEDLSFPNERQVGLWKTDGSPDHYGLSFPNERQVGLWKTDGSPDHYDRVKSVASSSFENRIPAGFQGVTSLEHPQPFLLQDQKVNRSLNRLAVGAERENSYSLPLSKPIDSDFGLRSNVKAEPASYFTGKVNMMGSQYESSLFTSSFSDLFSKDLRLSNNALCGHSSDTIVSYCEEEDVLESTKEVEAQTIGNLLPDDDDLLSGVVDEFEYNTLPNGGDCMEDLDLFSSVGGMDLEDDVSSAGHKAHKLSGGLSNCQVGDCSGLTVGEHPHGEHPSRTLFVRNINSNVEDFELKTLFKQYGDIHTLYTACKHRGFVMISYYDIRAARNAMKALQNRPLRRRKLDIHYSIPKDNPSEKDINKGTLVVMNLDSSVSNDELRQIFGAYGEIKEVREAPHRSQHKFIEFYDLRAAEAALCSLNGSDIAGKRIKLEPSRPGGVRRCLGQQFLLEQDECDLFLQQSSPPINSITGFSGESVGNKTGLIESNHLPGQQKFEIHGTPAFHPHSLPEFHDGISNCIHPNSLGNVAASINSRPSERIDNLQFGRVNSNGNLAEFNECVFESAGNSTSSLPGHHYTWNNSYNPQPPSVMWPNSQSFVNGICAADPSWLHGLTRAPSHILNRTLLMTNHHVGSAPAVGPSLWDRRSAYAGESSEVSGFHPGSLGNMRISNSLQSMEFGSQNMFLHLGGNCMDLSVPSKTVGLQSHRQRFALFPGRGQMIPVMNSFDPLHERARSRRNEGNSNQAVNKKQYELDIDRIMRGEDQRTTLMLKNIPNKYTSKMFLAAIDERHRGTYDFIYLPIDFKNKCNMGYAFINMTDPSLIVPFYQTFNGRKWEKFNSEKVASLAYARIQGKASLIAHFQNSSLMNEDKRCRPILFNTEGPNAGDQVPFPMGVNIRVRPGKTKGTNTCDENHNGSPPDMGNGEASSQGETSSSSM